MIDRRTLLTSAGIGLVVTDRTSYGQSQAQPVSTPASAPRLTLDQFSLQKPTLKLAPWDKKISDLTPVPPVSANPHKPGQPACLACDYAIAWSDFVVAVNQHGLPPTVKPIEAVLGEKLNPEMTMEELTKKLREKGLGDKKGFINLRANTIGIEQ